MIDFRYHVVSLVAVFLALAVGIVLGAGPLAQPIGDTLTGQVDKLREDRNALTTQLNTVQAQMNADQQMMEQLSQRVFAGLLEKQNIALIVMPGAEGDDVSALSTKITQAGGAVSAQVNLLENFFSPKKQAYREALSAQITQYLDDAAKATNPESTLAAAVGQLAFVGQNEALSGILTVEDTPLVQIPTPASQPARAAVIIGPRSKAGAKTSSSAATANEEIIPEQQLYGEFSRTISSFASGAVIYGAAASATDLVSLLRNTNTALTTVDGIGSISGLVTVPFALTATMNGTFGAWGTGENATGLLPPLLEVPDVVKTEPAPPDASANVAVPAEQSAAPTQ